MFALVESGTETQFWVGLARQHSFAAESRTSWEEGEGLTAWGQGAGLTAAWDREEEGEEWNI